MSQTAVVVDKAAAAKEKQRERMKKWRAQNKEHVKAYQKKWKADNAVAQAVYQKAYLDAYRATEDAQVKTWIRNLYKNYRITPDHFNTMWEAQEGKCAICETFLKPRGRELDAVAVDHNHETGEIRGLLCRGCNHGIGCLKDSPAVLESAAKYLRKRGHYG